MAIRQILFLAMMCKPRTFMRSFLKLASALLALAAGGEALAQQALRCSYLMLQKREPAGKYFINEMTLDYDSKSAFFYSENSFKSDSLSVLAFNEEGGIKNENAYSELTRVKSGSNHLRSIIAFPENQFIQQYHSIVFFKGSMPISIPQWKLLGDAGESGGYQCKKAEGEFLGRKWTVLYTEEVPVNCGPWLLWGAPGLIVFAQDSEQLIQFKLMAAKELRESRLQQALQYREALSSRKSAVSYSTTMKDAELMHSKAVRDPSYLSQLVGYGNSSSYTVDANGRKTIISSFPYIPLIPDGYWKDRK